MPEITIPEEGSIPLPNGCHLYWKLDKSVGCREYRSDEIGGGVFVWNTAVVDEYTLLAAIVHEAALRKAERILAERAARRGNPAPEG